LGDIPDPNDSREIRLKSENRKAKKKPQNQKPKKPKKAP
jgi:hypothetical protein